MLKWVTLCLLLITVLLIWFLWWQSQTFHAPAMPAPSTQPVSVESSVAPGTNTKVQPALKDHLITPLNEAAKSPLPSNLPLFGSLWQLDATLSVADFSVPLTGALSAAHLIRFDTRALLSLQPGDLLHLELGTNQFAASVSDVETLRTGAIQFLLHQDDMLVASIIWLPGDIVDAMFYLDLYMYALHSVADVGYLIDAELLLPDIAQGL